MNIEQIFLSFLVIGILSAITLIIVPEINYSIKTILIFIISTLWIYVSINFLAVNFLYITRDSTGIFILISATGGILASILAGSMIIAFLNEKRK